MLHIHTNQWQAMKGIVQRNQTDCAFHDPIQSHFAFNNQNHLFSLWSYSNNYEKWQQGTIGKITLAKKFTIQNILCQSHLGLFQKKYFNRYAFCHIQGFHKAGLKKSVCLPPFDSGFTSRSVDQDFSLSWWGSVPFPVPYNFWHKLCCGKKNLPWLLLL